MIDDGGAAFPHVGEYEKGDHSMAFHAKNVSPGMSLHDHYVGLFVAAVIQGRTSDLSRKYLEHQTSLSPTEMAFARNAADTVIRAKRHAERHQGTDDES